MEKRRIDQESWYEPLTERLANYKENQARVKVLRIMLMKEVLPDTKEIASYGDTGGRGHEEISPKEIELVQKEQEVAMIEAALNGLKEDEKNIVTLRYIEGARDWHIYEIKIRMSKSYYYELRNTALEKVNGLLADSERNTSI